MRLLFLFQTSKKENLPVINPITSDGHFTERAPLVSGMWFKDADKVVSRDLRERGLLYRHETILHNYPHDWRKGTPLMSYPVEGWFIRTTAIKDRLIELMSENPRRIYDLPDQPNTWVEVDPNIRYAVDDQQLLTKCGWSPFRGLTVYGRIVRVILRGKPVFEQGKVLAKRGSGFLYPPDQGDVRD